MEFEQACVPFLEKGRTNKTNTDHENSFLGSPSVLAGRPPSAMTLIGLLFHFSSCSALIGSFETTYIKGKEVWLVLGVDVDNKIFECVCCGSGWVPFPFARRSTCTGDAHLNAFLIQSIWNQTLQRNAAEGD
uniref:Uncharacterized protein n=1 Tax=Minutocellus polymorphus TaxID=265543 RepID=A0A7S0FQP8_9STRA|mmetsp:Transcript_5837/g.9818  ORF Transcript_5837/g.9818 Transcript_5837/m.9818 type:complete len:132 (+) Transcript_5837:53-448(+)